MQKHQHQPYKSSTRSRRKSASICSSSALYKVWRYATYASLATMAGLACLSISPIMHQDVSAETLTSTLATKTTANLYSMISLSLSESIDIDLTPKSSGEISFGVAELKVATNNTTGYSIMLSTVDQSNELKAVDTSQHYTGQEDVEYSIKPLTSSTTAADYLGSSNNLNTWGYALTNGTSNAETVYNGLSSASGDTVYTTRSTSSNDSYNLNIAVAVDADLPAGQYRNGIVVSAVANPLELRGFNEIYYMQEMTPDVCSRATIGDEGQLVDKRDRTIYWVAKLKDNNCWMTQNLDLDLSTDVALTPEDTNVTEPWTPPVNTTKGEVYPIENSSNTYQRPLHSYDPGKYVLTNYSTGPGCNNVASVSQCTNVTNVEQEYQPSFTASNNLAVDSANGKYDAHYLMGNLYQFNTAVAGAATPAEPSKTSYDTDICPKGWRLPTTILYRATSDELVNNALGEENEFYQLVAAYGWDSGYRIDTGWSNFIFTPFNTSTQKINEAPLYFAFFSYIRPVDGGGTQTTPSVFAGSNMSYFFTSSRFSEKVGEAMHVNHMSDRIYPGTASIWAYDGGNIRCIAK